LDACDDDLDACDDDLDACDDFVTIPPQCKSR